MTSLNGNIFRVTGHLCGEFIGHRWIPRTRASDTELSCFFICAFNKRFEAPLRPLWRHCKGTICNGKCQEKWASDNGSDCTRESKCDKTLICLRYYFLPILSVINHVDVLTGLPVDSLHKGPVMWNFYVFWIICSINDSIVVIRNPISPMRRIYNDITLT